MRTKLNSNGLKNLITRIVRESINEKMVDRFTPYTDKDREENFTPFTSKDTRTSFQRNPSYEKALKDAEERRKKKQAGITEEGFDRIVRESINKVLGEMYELDSQKEEFDGYDNDLTYDSIYDQAYDFLYKHPELYEKNFQEIASAMGFRMETIGPNDYKVLRNAIKAVKDRIFWNEQ